MAEQGHGGRDRLRALLEDNHQYGVASRAPGPSGSLPLTEDMLRQWPSGDLFGLSQNVGMGWRPERVLNDPVLILSTQGGMRDETGAPQALGYHTGHWEISRLVQRAAAEFRDLGAMPYAAFVSDPCDGRTQGTPGMFDSLPYRNDASLVMRRLIRSLPRRRAVMGVATCDKGLPAMMMAVASVKGLPGILVPGGVTLLAEDGEDAAKVQTIGARFTHGEISLEHAAAMGCRACASPGGGCQFLGTAATSQVVAEALGMALPHTALVPSGSSLWEEMARDSARALRHMMACGWAMDDVLTDASIANAMAVHAAFGGSTNLLLHLPAIAHTAGRRVPTVDDWRHVNREVPRLVSVLPNGPVPHPTVYAYLAGGVPEVMLHLRRLGLLDTTVKTVAGTTLGEVLDWWESSERRIKVRKHLETQDGVNPDDVIFSPDRARQAGLGITITFPVGNLAPQGAVIKSTAIDPTVLDHDGVYRHRGPARVFTQESEAIRAIKKGAIKAGDVMVLAGRGPMGTGMEETYQLTSALRYLPFGKHVALITDARFSGVSTGACIGHVSPEGLAGGPIGKVRDGDIIDIVINPATGEGSLNFVGTPQQPLSPEDGTHVLQERPLNPDMEPDPDLPDDTRLWAALQSVSGGPWRGAVYDVDRIVAALGRGLSQQG
ncbi:YjhG/YagF family D-xylonate dehydratase [Sulfobacillus sp. DSM 109850]|uniref:YjhG/YagF family D-xylonate dehydratase n=2 Tax=Sulfobacillus harzensis TaxID=2729629 RepID=A0A7Y0L1K0_9FIRM|nr:YjhG/YagF family D-xylonate dehydratase [Sulfobacillus harzensis]